MTMEVKTVTKKVRKRITTEIKDGITDELARPMVRNVSAAIDLVQLDSAVRKHLIADQNI